MQRKSENLGHTGLRSLRLAGDQAGGKLLFPSLIKPSTIAAAAKMLKAGGPQRGPGRAMPRTHRGSIGSTGSRWFEVLVAAGLLSPLQDHDRTPGYRAGDRRAAGAARRRRRVAVADGNAPPGPGTPSAVSVRSPDTLITSLKSSWDAKKNR
jgi:hypothetical protein